MLLDLNATLQRLGDDRDLLDLLVRVFIEDAPGMFVEIESLAAASQWQPLHRAAHSLRGLAANLDAKAVTDHTLQLELQTAAAERRRLQRY